MACALVWLFSHRGRGECSVSKPSECGGPLDCTIIECLNLFIYLVESYASPINLIFLIRDLENYMYITKTLTLTWQSRTNFCKFVCCCQATEALENKYLNVTESSIRIHPWLRSECVISNYRAPVECVIWPIHVCVHIHFFKALYNHLMLSDDFAFSLTMNVIEHKPYFEAHNGTI